MNTPVIIKQIQDNIIIEYGRGKFDDWCVYLTIDGDRRAPRDTDYFERLHELGKIHTHQKIYDDFTRIYDFTAKNINKDVLDLISALSRAYADDAIEIEIWFTVIYAGMVAEENKQGTRLGKRIKRLGMRQALLEHLPAAEAAVFSKGKPWRELDALMRAKGF